MNVINRGLNEIPQIGKFSLLKNFRGWPHPQKIDARKIFCNELLCVATVYFCVCAFCMQLPLALNPRCLLHDLCCSIICSSPALQFITKLVDRCVDLTTPLGHADPIRCSIEVRELIQRVGLQDHFDGNISLSLLSLSSVLCVSMVAVPTVLVRKVTYEV